MQIDFDMSCLPIGNPPVSELETSFLPPDLELKVVERPRVIIKYLGRTNLYSAERRPQLRAIVNQAFSGRPALI
jgi:hypothetical protein